MRIPLDRLLVGLCVFLAGCGENGTGPGTEDVQLELRLEGLRALDPQTEGGYQVWVIDGAGGIRSAGRFDFPSDGRLVTTSPVADPEFVMITVEPPGDTDSQPSAQKLMGGRFSGSTAVLDVNRYVTAGIPLEPKPGTHVLFTPSDNAELGYPSNEDAGIWLFNIRGDTTSGSFFLTFTPLTRGWMYEGWAVRDYGTPDAVWASYGKFEPDAFRKQRTRDNTGLGPFSGQLDYRRAMVREIEFPGDDWVSNPHGYPVPGDLPLPFDLNGNAALGIRSRWTHVITIEPATDEDEDPWWARPFLLQPYQNPFGEGPPEEPRVIEYHPDLLPRGTATLLQR